MMHSINSFEPVLGPDARVLILGSIPGLESLRRQQYYAHPRNAFWPMMGELLNAGFELEYSDRLEMLKRRGVALWDVLESCERSGSLDANIRTSSMQVNDFPGLFQRCPKLERILFNGRKAEDLFRRRAMPLLQDHLKAMKLIRLPSTSPAHAAMSFNQKLAAWRLSLLET